jgi:hypothetical protein
MVRRPQLAITLFARKAFPLLYLPCDVSFRMTDIWPSFVVLVVPKRKERLVVFDVRGNHPLFNGDRK